MDELDFLRGIEGESQNGQDLVAGAEHFIRLKKQVGFSRPAEHGLELEKDAGELAESLATPATCKGCGKVKTSCMCKTAGLKEILQGARSGLKYQSMGVGAGLKGLKMPGAKSRSAGMLAGMAAPVAAAGGVGYLAGKATNEKEKTAQSLYSCLNARLEEMREKTANSVLERLKDVNPGLVSATGLGALAGGLGTYLSSRPQKDSGKSKAEEDLEGRVKAQENQPERGLLGKIHHRNTELEHGYAKAFREHPGKASIIGAITGAMGGYGIGQLAGAAARMRRGQ